MILICRGTEPSQKAQLKPVSGTQVLRYSFLSDKVLVLSFSSTSRPWNEEWALKTYRIQHIYSLVLLQNITLHLLGYNLKTQLCIPVSPGIYISTFGNKNVSPGCTSSLHPPGLRETTHIWQKSARTWFLRKWEHSGDSFNYLSPYRIVL